LSAPIQLEMKIAEIVASHPETRAVFAAHGLAQLVSEEGLRVLAPFLTLGTALRSRGLAAGTVLRLLGEAAEAGPVLEAPGLGDIGRAGELTLLALMPCGLKVPFGRAVAPFLEDLKARTGLEITYAVEGNLNQELSYYPYVDTVESPDELPDVIVSADFNVFYYHRFHRKFVAPGHFVGYGEVRPTAAFAAAGLIDPLGEYFVFGVNPLVIVADLDRLGGRSLPGSWDDLLDPVWSNEITLRGSADFFCHAVLLPLYQRHGPEGLRRLAPNVRQGLHPSQMVKRIDAGEGGALYVMPEFFAHRVKNRRQIAILWPEEGALASPVTLQVKRSRVDELRPVLDWLTGPELARALVGARFPVPHSGVEGELQEAPLKWLGWDYIRRHDIAALNAAIDAVFLPAVREVTG
jgi:ABC-type Fe3+ transport system substrate-binding protein